MTTPQTPAERAQQQAAHAAILNRVSVALARSQRLVDSWLPPSNTAENENDDEELRGRGVPDTAGLGARPDMLGATAGGPLEELRKRLVGKKAGRGVAGAKGVGAGVKGEEGRVSAREVAKRRFGEVEGEVQESAESSEEESRAAAIRGKKGKGNGAFLDQVLRERAGKGKGRKKATRKDDTIKDEDEDKSEDEIKASKKQKTSDRGTSKATTQDKSKSKSKNKSTSKAAI